MQTLSLSSLQKEPENLERAHSRLAALLFGLSTLIFLPLMSISIILLGHHTSIICDPLALMVQWSYKLASDSSSGFLVRLAWVVLRLDPQIRIWVCISY